MRILVVEDDLTIQKQLKNLLSGNGYEVDTVTDFSKVIEQIKTFAPHLVLLDIKLPGNSGFEICSQIRSFSDIPICIMKDGKEVIQGSPDTLKSVLRQNVIQVKFATNEDAQKYLPLLQQRQSSQTFSVRNASVLCNSNDDRSDMLDLMTFLLEHHIPLIGVEIVQPTLEDVFIRLTQDGREGCA